LYNYTQLILTFIGGDARWKMFTEGELKEFINMLKKDEIGKMIGLEKKEWTKMKKDELVQLYFNEIQNSEIHIKNFFKTFDSRLTHHPNTVEEMLNISKAERKSWTDEGKLKVSSYQVFSN
jgi:glycosylphosphatidylinositol transamidase (GPIT) subunit GPI8